MRYIAKHSFSLEKGDYIFSMHRGEIREITDEAIIADLMAAGHIEERPYNLDITENGTYDVTNYGQATVEVSGGGVNINTTYDITDGKLNKGNTVIEGDVIANIPDGVTVIGAGAFMNNSIISSVIIPDSVTSIEDGKPWTTTESGAFYGCTNLTSITIPDSVTSIGGYAFYGCTNLTSITIPDSVTSIGTNAFFKCANLTSITIPDSVTSIGGYAFRDCTNLTSITIPDSVTSIETNAFQDCTSLTDIYYTGTQSQWESIEGITDAAIPEGATIHYEYTPE